MSHNLKTLLKNPQPPSDLIAQIKASPGTPVMLEILRQSAPDVRAVPHTPYTVYREFERRGYRGNYERAYFMKRMMLTRAVLELILGDETMIDPIHDLVWSMCEETSWVLPAHEEQGPDYWELHPSPRTCTGTALPCPYGAHTALTREPDAIDLFAAETGASLAETIYLVGDKLAPEVVQRARQEVERRIFKPYLAYARKHWWFKGALNWNGVCNGSIALAFLRLEKDLTTLSEALELALEGFEAYIATGFEPDGGSIEGIGYWNYGLVYYTTVAELLKELTGGQLDLLAAPRMKAVANYPLVTALAPGIYLNFGDAVEELALNPGIVQRIAERTGVQDLRRLIITSTKMEGRGAAVAKLAVILRDAAWWDGVSGPFPASAHADAYLPDCAVAKFAGQTADGRRVILAAKAGHNDGHHSHTDVGHFVLNVAGESLLPDPGRGLYSREYFRDARYANIFCNGIGHSVPVIGGKLQQPGPEFGGRKQFHGELSVHAERDGQKTVEIEMSAAYDLPALTRAQRALNFDPTTGAVTLTDEFAFDGAALSVQEAFVTWGEVEVQGAKARITGRSGALELNIFEPAGAAFELVSLAEECRKNQREGELKRLVVGLPEGEVKFRMGIVVK